MQQQFGKCLLIAILTFNFGWGQVLTPPIQNFSSIQYAAASQNWDIGIDSLGIVYTANSEGLLSYDGQQWEKHSLKAGSMIRSVFPYEGRVYTGAYKEFGYWERDKMGRMNYISLSEKLRDYKMGNEEIWDILQYQNAIYFRSFAAIYKLENNAVVPVTNKVTNAMQVFGGELLVSMGQQGIFSLQDNGDLIPFENSGVLKGKTVIEMEGDGEQLLLGTRDALFSCKDSKCNLFSDRKLNDLLEKYELNHTLRISEDELVFATVKNGIIHYNRDSGKIRVYNRTSGLQNNTVLGMAENKGKLWLSLDNGIDVIDLNAPIHFYTDDTGELGAVYDMINFQNNIYLASNTGVYEFSNDGLKLVEGAEGHSWNLEVINGKLYSNHNTGTYEIRAGMFVPIEERTGSFCIIPKPAENNILYIGNYTGVSIYSTLEKELVEVPGVNFPVNKILFGNNGIIWASHPYEGVYRIIPGPSNAEDFLVENIGSSNNGENNYKADLFKINNQIAVFRNNIWYKFNEFADSLLVFDELKEYKNHRLLLEDENNYWFINNLNSSIVYTDFKDLKVSLSFDELNKRLVKGYEKLIKGKDSLYYLTLNDGFGRINLKEMLSAKTNDTLTKPLILGFEDSDVQYDLSKTPVIPYSQAKQLKIKVGYTNSNGSKLFYVLGGNGIQKGRVLNGLINFQNLAAGNYRLEVFALNSQEVPSKISLMEFIVRPPWYLSTTIKFLYILLSIGIFSLVYQFNKRKLKKHQFLLEQKFKKEHEERLSRLEKENLLNEINNKRKELANTTMIGAKKNEILLDIQGELSKDKEKFSNQFRLKHLMNKISNAIKNKDEWKLFETNFNELHEDFFKELLLTYPNLSNRDLKLCSYLKMNLSSKEIAPLMGISVRGVEVHRYRLRKKMNLDNKENLTNFLIKGF